MIEQRNYTHIPTYVFKADAALDVTSASGQGQTSASQQQPKKHAGSQVSPERERLQTKLDVSSALASLGQGHYDKVAATLLKTGLPKTLEDWNGKVYYRLDFQFTIGR